MATRFGEPRAVTVRPQTLAPVFVSRYGKLVPVDMNAADAGGTRNR